MTNLQKSFRQTSSRTIPASHQRLPVGTCNERGELTWLEKSVQLVKNRFYDFPEDTQHEIYLLRVGYMPCELHSLSARRNDINPCNTYLHIFGMVELAPVLMMVGLELCSRSAISFCTLAMS